MISIVRSIGQQIEVAYDLLAERVVVVPQFSHRTVWLTEAEAEALAESLTEAVRCLRRRREEKGRL